MHGARKKIEEKGFPVAGFRRSNNCVSDHRAPDRAEARMTNTKPIATNCASLATIIMTPIVMTEMIATSFQVIFSSRNRNAKISTKASEDDLHIAAEMLAGRSRRAGGRGRGRGLRAVEGQRYKLQTHVP